MRLFLIITAMMRSVVFGWCARLSCNYYHFDEFCLFGWRARLFLITITTTTSFVFFRMACVVIFDRHHYHKFVVFGGVHGYF